MTRITGIDPGKATGWAGGVYSDTEPFELKWAHITPNFNESLEIWFNSFYDNASNGRLVVERFVLRGQNFVPNIEGVKFEGVIEATWDQYFNEIIWQPISMKGKRGKASKTSAFDSELKRLGMWQTGKMVGHKDGRDANDAIIHILKRLIADKHMPTLEAYFPDLL